MSTGPLFGSFDGSNWTAHASSPEQLSSVGYAGNHFIGVGVKGRIIESDPVRIPLQPRLDTLRYLAGDSFQFALSLIFPHLRTGFRESRNGRNSLTGAALAEVGQAPAVGFR